ncbi:hypothetical protein ATPR_0149 [Acetobacter tropicalis NBRC 101654]|uniref:Uncharacterized protein n=1 Tax=Acetobacter tropicalis NBRC 101654 TaxID=749388 RepID=F7V9V0_9PROT|nr:hypothetical protein ATPR_0149 [Acetobacter tropicalis NBRC 101654]
MASSIPVLNSNMIAHVFPSQSSEAEFWPDGIPFFFSPACG